MKQAIFTWLDEDLRSPRFLGLHDPSRRWNGWAIPYFTEEVALKIMEESTKNGNYICKFENEKFYYYDNPEVSGTDGEPMICEWVFETLDGIKYYPVGGCNWTWVEEENKLFNRVDLSGRGMHYNIDLIHIYNDEDEHEDNDEFFSWLQSAASGDEYTEFNNRKYVCI